MLICQKSASPRMGKTSEYGGHNLLPEQNFDLGLRQAAPFFFRARFKLVCLAYLTQGAQQIGIIRSDDLVIFGRRGGRFFPTLERSAIKLSSFWIIATRMVNDSQVAF